MHPLNTPAQTGGILSARRKARKIPQREFAARLGISQNRLSELEHHPEKLTLDRLFAMLNLLGLELAIHERGTPTGKAAKKTEW